MMLLPLPSLLAHSFHYLTELATKGLTIPMKICPHQSKQTDIDCVGKNIYSIRIRIHCQFYFWKTLFGILPEYFKVFGVAHASSLWSCFWFLPISPPPSFISKYTYIFYHYHIIFMYTIRTYVFGVYLVVGQVPTLLGSWSKTCRRWKIL